MARPLTLVCAAVVCAVLVGCPRAIDNTLVEQLLVQGGLRGPSGPVDVAFDDARAFGEWWPCDARLTSSGCVGDRHVNVYLALPAVSDFPDLGQGACVAGGAATGVFEMLRSKFRERAPVAIPGDVNAFVMVASDVNDDGSADLVDEGETLASARLVEGTLLVKTFGDFDDPFAFEIDGRTDDAGEVRVVFRGAMSSPATVPGLEDPDSCVAPAE